MHARQITAMSVDDFLAWEALQPEKWELVDGAPILRRTRLMAGGTPRHAQIAANIIIALGAQLRGGPCRVYTSDLKVRSDRAVRYPDVTVDCGTGERAKTAETPRVVFEVLSPSNNAFQQMRLLHDYQSIPAVEEIVFVNQEGLDVQVWRRRANGWAFEEFETLEGDIALASIAAALPTAAIYDGVVFEAPQADDSFSS
jgi:Uma2 family endonuclease